MSDTFFCRKAEVQIKELIDELYKRLEDSRRLLKMYDEDPDLARRGHDKGYAQGIREEIAYLDRLLDKVERS
jgi:hypothetical protein